MAKKTLKLTLSNKENQKNNEKASFLACFFTFLDKFAPLFLFNITIDFSCQ